MKPIRPTQPSYSAIVCAYNEEKHLTAVLEGLLSATFLAEIIVVDDGSKDHTAEIIKEYQQFDRIHPIFIEPNQGKGNAMAEGAATARGDILLFVDADLANWNAGYARQVLQPILEGKADMVIGYPLREHDAWDSDLRHRYEGIASTQGMVQPGDSLTKLPGAPGRAGRIMISINAPR